MNIFVTLDRNYLNPLKVMLGSLFLNNADEDFDVYLAAEDIDETDLNGLDTLCFGGHVSYHFIEVKDEWFADAPTMRYYSRAMYYRLLAAQMLPQSLDRALYLDPDILVIGKIRPLYDIEFGDALYAAAMHKGLTSISGQISKIRLPDYEADDYYNSGVLMMNLQQIRKEVYPSDIFDYVKKHHQVLILPDQDVLNSLYGTRILSLDDAVWNYDARKYDTYRLASQGEADMDWVAKNTVFLHFCGKKKPWQSSYRGRFSALYKHYQALILRRCWDMC